MYCQSCGNDTPEQGIFCLHCGTRLNKECPRCAEIVRLKAKACRFCGYEFTSEEMAEIEQVEQERAARQRAEETKVLRETAERVAQRTRLEQERQAKAELEKKQRADEEAEYPRWHRPEVVGGWGSTVLQCPQCHTLNPHIIVENCRRCSTSLKSAPQVKNPYL